MKRSRLKVAFFVSLLLHAGALLWLALHTPPPTPAERRGPPPIELEIVETPPPVKAAEPQPPSPKAPSHVAAQRSPPEPTTTPPAERRPAPVDNTPRRSAPLTLLPGSDFVVPGEPAEPPRGHTLHPDDPQFQPENIRREEERRVHDRVDGWAQDLLAEARAQGGLPDPYFWRVRDAAVSRLGKRAKEAGVAPTEGSVMRKVAERYAAGAESYAKTGNPNLGPIGTAPRQSEILKERFGNEPGAESLRALVQAWETQQDLMHGKPQLTLILELHQFQDGRPPQVRLLESSADPKFDALVIAEWPKSMDAAGAPPAKLFHREVLRTIWGVEGWLGIPKKMEQVFQNLPVPGVLGFSVDQIAPMLTEEGFHYEFHARLLRQYP